MLARFEAMQYAELMRPIRGETEKDRLERLTKGEELKGSIVEHLGGARALGIRGTLQTLGFLDQLGQQAAGNPYRGATPQLPGLPGGKLGAGALPARQMLTAPAGAVTPGAPGVQVSGNQIIINVPPRSGDLSEADFQEFYRLYQRARNQERREAGLLGPARR